MIHGYTIAINSTNNCDRVPLPHLHDVHFPQKSSTDKGHIRPHSFMNANIMKTKFCHKMSYDLTASLSNIHKFVKTTSF